MSFRMNDRFRARHLLALVLLCFTGAAVAEDIDLFLGPPVTENEDAPNVLFVIDNTANWSQSMTVDSGRTTVFDQQQEALVEVFGLLPAGEIRVGLLMYTETGGDDSGEDGAYIRAAIRTMTDDTLNDSGSVVTEGTKIKYQRLLEGLDENIDKANGGRSAKALAETYMYYAGNAPKAGNRKAKTDYIGNDFTNRRNNPTCCEESHDVWALEGDAEANNKRFDGNAIFTGGSGAKSSTPYNSPTVEGSCGGNYVIFIGNGPAQDPASDNRDAGEWLFEVGGEAAIEEIEQDDPQTQAKWVDEWARFMKNSDEDIRTFTVDINPDPERGQGPEWTILMQTMAEVGGGEYYALHEDFDADDLVKIITDILSGILAADSVFASVTLPASSGTQSTFLNQVFIGVFRPDGLAKPRWPGNTKQYKLGRPGGPGTAIRLVDQDNMAAIDSETGFFQECSRSFWTDTVTGRDDYWEFLDDSGGCLTPSSSADYDTPDGPNVEKGAQAYMMRETSHGSRTVYTCSATFSGCDDDTNSLTLFTTGNSGILATDIGASTAERDEYINWMRGQDVDDVNDDGSIADTRAYVHADVVHSRPLAWDFNSDPNDPDIVVFYGSNDGMLKAVNGNQTAANGSVAAGDEYWAFLPPEAYDNIETLRENTAEIGFPSSGANAGVGISKPYGFDGQLALYQEDVDDDSTPDRWLFGGMRRGGRVVYALDVTNIGSPALKWKVGCDDDGTCTTGGDFDDIGQTWSPIAVTHATGYLTGTANSPILMMGGGYDECEDDDNDGGDPDAGVDPVNNSCTDTSLGRGVYILDADDGSLLNYLETDRAVPGGVIVVYNDSRALPPDLSIKYAYTADTGGNVYRIHAETDSGEGDGSTLPAMIGTTPPDEWVITKIAALGCDSLDSDDASDLTCDANRKFLFNPDVVEDPEVPNRNVVLLGSGDREKPLTSYGTTFGLENYFYSIVDYPLQADWFDSETSTCNTHALVCVDSLATIDIDGGVGDLAEDELSDKGWKYPLRDGEQVISGALTLSNVVNFSTHIPAQYVDGACDTNLGTATTYNINYRSADGEPNDFPPGGLLPTPVAGLVDVDDDGDPELVCSGCGEGPVEFEEEEYSLDVEAPINRVYWNIEQ